MCAACDADIAQEREQELLDNSNRLYNLLEALEGLPDANQRLLDVGNMVSARLRSLWNEETRQYEPHDEMVFLHALINKLMVTVYFLRTIGRAVED